MAMTVGVQALWNAACWYKIGPRIPSIAQTRFVKVLNPTLELSYKTAGNSPLYASPLGSGHCRGEPLQTLLR